MAGQDTSKLPRDAHTLRTMLKYVIEASLPNMTRLRDREQTLQMLSYFRDASGLQGAVRRIVPTGIVRNSDDLGRIVIPAELRRTLGIGEGDSLSISAEGEYVVLEKFSQACVFCGRTEDINEVKGRYVCETCIGDICLG